MMEGRCATIRGGVVDIAFEITVDKLYWFSFHFIFFGLWLLLVFLFPCL